MGKARSLGVSVAKGNIIAFIDDDAVASPQWTIKLASSCNLIIDLRRHYMESTVLTPTPT